MGPMNEAWIVQSKLTPPSPPVDWLVRALHPIGQGPPPLTFLVAGPGYGKTLGLLSLVTAKIDAAMTIGEGQ